MATTVAGTLMMIEESFDGFATDAAVTVTVRFAGMEEGALYVTDAEVWFVSDPQAAPVQPEPESDQVTPLFDGSLERVAAILTVCPC
jgi:hypothetical protein